MALISLLANHIVHSLALHWSGGALILAMCPSQACWIALWILATKIHPFFEYPSFDQPGTFLFRMNICMYRNFSLGSWGDLCVMIWWKFTRAVAPFCRLNQITVNLLMSVLKISDHQLKVLFRTQPNFNLHVIIVHHYPIKGIAFDWFGRQWLVDTLVHWFNCSLCSMRFQAGGVDYIH